jgi:hypothetical protein
LTYLQGELGFAERWATTFTFGAHAGLIGSPEVDRYEHLRFDVAMRYRINATIRASIGLALTRNNPDQRARLGGELRLTFEWLRPD